jgi:hypothetical protein
MTAMAQFADIDRQMAARFIDGNGFSDHRRPAPAGTTTPASGTSYFPQTNE